MKNVRSTICACLLCAAMVVSLPVAGSANHESNSLIRTDCGLWNTTSVVTEELPFTSLEQRGDSQKGGAVYADRSCTVESVETLDDGTQKVVLRFDDATTVTIWNNFSCQLSQGKRLEKGDLIGRQSPHNPTCQTGNHYNHQRKRSHLSLSVEQNGASLTGQQIREQGLVKTTWAGFEDPTTYLSTSADLWTNPNYSYDAELGLQSTSGEGTVYVQQSCVVESVAPFLGDEANTEVTLLFPDGTRAKLRQDFLPLVTEGQELKPLTAVGVFADKDLTNAKHITVSMEQNGKTLTSKTIIDNDLVYTQHP